MKRIFLLALIAMITLGNASAARKKQEAKGSESQPQLQRNTFHHTRRCGQEHFNIGLSDPLLQKLENILKD